MNAPRSLLTRLDEIGISLQKSGQALALIGLGSVGQELERLDAFSDLDFFVIVEQGHKPRYIENLDWLSEICPLAYYFKNTPDGYKLLFEDGIFCEFAIFEQAELSKIPFDRGRVIWKQDHIPENISLPQKASQPPSPHPVEWLVGEALTNLYVGLGRYQRGERLSAARFIQGYAVDRILELIPLIGTESPAPKDVFDPIRRIEQRFPNLVQELPDFMQGYTRSRESALAILTFLEQHFDVNPAIAAAIRQLCAKPDAGYSID